MDLTIEDFECQEHKGEIDNHLLVRETPAWKVRERWAQIRLLEHQKKLERELAVAHLEEHIDPSLVPIAMLPPKKLTWWEAAQEKLRIYFCIFFHTAPNYRRGDHFYTCNCGRKYALPWADVSKLPSDVYVPTKPFVAPTKAISQVKCKNGWMGEV